MQYTGIKTIKDNLGITDDQVIGAFSFYENNKNLPDFTFKNNSPEYFRDFAIDGNGELIFITKTEILFPSTTGLMQLDIYEGNITDGWDLIQSIPRGITNIDGGLTTGLYETHMSRSGDIIFSPTRVFSSVNATSGVIDIYTGDRINGWNYKQTLRAQSPYRSIGRIITSNEDSSIIITTQELSTLNLNKVSIYTGNKFDGWQFKEDLSFGSASNISIKNNNIVVSDINSPGFFRGSMKIYTGDINNGWNIKQSFTGEQDASAFGSSAKFIDNGNILLAGAPNINLATGIVYIYTGDAINGWSIKQKITGAEFSDPSRPNYFGVSINPSEDGSIISIGAWGEKDLGSISIYTGNKNNKWELNNKFYGSPVLEFLNDTLGTYVRSNISGNIIFDYRSPTAAFSEIRVYDLSSRILYGNNISNVVYPDFWATNSITGVLQTSNYENFFQYSGTGYFDGNTIMQLNKPIPTNDFSVFLSYEKLRYGNEILLSTLTGDSLNNLSGFCLGVNDANKLYFKYVNPVEGIFTLVYENVLANKNLIYLNVEDTNVTIGRYNNNTFSFENQTFFLFQNAFRNSNILNVGGINLNNSLFNNLNNFSGYIDKLFIFENVSTFYIEELASGLFLNPEALSTEGERFCSITGFFESGYFEISGITGQGVTASQIILGTGITGYQLVPTGRIYSGIIGYQDVVIGSYIDNCGILRDIFERVAVSGAISGSSFIEVPVTGFIYGTVYQVTDLTGVINSGFRPQAITGESCFQGTEITSINYGNVDLNYLSSLSFNEISLLLDQENFSNTGDIVEVYFEPYKFENLLYNRNLTFNSLNRNFVIDRRFRQNEMLLFANGQTIIDSGYNTITSGYETFNIPNFDYFITGNRIETNRFFNDSDNLFYDYISGNFWALERSGNNTINLPNNISNNYWIFRNGQKLISGRDYLIEIGLVFFNEVFDKDSIIFKEIPNNFNYLSGISGFLKLTGYFNNNCSQVYYNGIKQKINDNYIENSNFDMISGIFLNHFNDDIIYNNTDNFFIINQN